MTKTHETRAKSKQITKKLSPQEVQILNDVKGLQPLSIAKLADDKTENVIRPCFSLAYFRNISLNDWNYWDKFSQFYIKRVIKEKSAFLCTYDTSNIPDHLNSRVYDVHCIIADVKDDDGNIEFLLTQYFCEHANFNVDQQFVCKNKGEISWQPVTNFPDNILAEYKRKNGKFHRDYLTLDAFTSRPTKGRANSTKKLPNLNIIESNGLSCTALKNLIEENYSMFDINKE